MNIERPSLVFYILYFTKYFNISSSQFIIESKGEREPISKENDLNRRVDFVVTQ